MSSQRVRLQILPDRQAAARQGWNLLRCEHGEGGEDASSFVYLAIRALPDPPLFEDDLAAERFVLRQAMAGDDLAIRTLKFFSDEAPLSFLRTVDRVLGIEDQFFVPPSR